MVLKTKSKTTKKNTKNNTKNNTKKNTKHNVKPYKINVYAKNMRYMESNDTSKSTYDINKDKYKLLLSKLTEALGENQWLKYSENKYKPIQHIDKTKINTTKNDYQGFKPQGSYYSKGGWLFHQDNCCQLDKEIIFIEVDYKTIYRITGKEPFKSPIKNSIYKNTLTDFMNKYGVNFRKDKCEPFIGCFEYDTEDECNNPKTSCIWNSEKKTIFNKKGKCVVSKSSDSCSQLKTEKECKSTKNNKNSKRCLYNYSYKIINWAELYKNYNGFAIYPYPEYEMMTSRKNRSNFFSFIMYDVETLVLWDHTPVIKHHNFGTIRDILKDSGLTDKDIKDNDDNLIYFYEHFIPHLIKKINVINNK
jgi:hypothetical protein